MTCVEFWKSLSDAAVLGDTVRYSRSAEDCAEASDYVIPATPREDFLKVGDPQFRGKVVFDCWRFLGDSVKKATTYFSIGPGRVNQARTREFF
jgi:hypothetical protein